MDRKGNHIRVLWLMLMAEKRCETSWNKKRKTPLQGLQSYKKRRLDQYCTCSASLPQGQKCGVAAWQWMLTTYDDYNYILHFYEHTCKSPLTASVFMLFNIPDPFFVVSPTEKPPRTHPEPTHLQVRSKLKFHNSQPEPSPISPVGNAWWQTEKLYGHHKAWILWTPNMASAPGIFWTTVVEISVRQQGGVDFSKKVKTPCLGHSIGENILKTNKIVGVHKKKNR